MSFHETSTNIRIEVRGDHTVLLASVEDENGEYIAAELNLDEGISNADGKC